MVRRIKSPGPHGSRPAHFLKAWREHAGLTQDEAIAALAAVGTSLSKPSISRLENGHQPYSEPILLALSAVYQSSPAELIGRDPAGGRSLDSLVASLPPQERARLLAAIRAFVTAGADSDSVRTRTD